MSAPARIEIVYGTRPEAIKTAPVVQELRRRSRIQTTVTVTGQHRQIADEVNAHFGVVPDVDLDLLRPGVSLPELGAAIFTALAARWSASAPDAVMVQGDTATAAVAAVAAHYAGSRVVHLEAGLRSGDLGSPFPEEGNRRLVAAVCSLHLAPTPAARDNLLREGVDAAAITVTGNTVIDALHTTFVGPVRFDDPRLERLISSDLRVVLVTAHRRESWGAGLAQIAAGILDAISARPDVAVVLPMHPNPAVRSVLTDVLGAADRVVLCEPLAYGSFRTVLARSHVVVTDSGGVQEEAPALGVPVLVTRERTERTEAIAAGCARLIGTRRDRVAAELGALLDDRDRHRAMSHTANPFGDGRAAERAAAAVEHLLGVGERLPEFRPEVGPRGAHSRRPRERAASIAPRLEA